MAHKDSETYVCGVKQGGESGAITFDDLTDTPSSKSGAALQYVRVNAAANALEYAAVSGTGDVVGPASAVDSNLAAFDTTTGKLIKDSGVSTANVIANNAKVTNATHTGDVTGSTTLTIAAGAVDVAMMSATGTPSATTYYRGDNTWSTPPGGGGGVSGPTVTTITSSNAAFSGSVITLTSPSTAPNVAFSVGELITITGADEVANNGVFYVTALTATTITCGRDSFTADATDTGVSISNSAIVGAPVSYANAAGTSLGLNRLSTTAGFLCNTGSISTAAGGYSKVPFNSSSILPTGYHRTVANVTSTASTFTSTTLQLTGMPGGQWKYWFSVGEQFVVNSPSLPANNGTYTIASYSSSTVTITGTFPSTGSGGATSITGVTTTVAKVPETGLYAFGYNVACYFFSPPTGAQYHGIEIFKDGQTVNTSLSILVENSGQLFTSMGIGFSPLEFDKDDQISLGTRVISGGGSGTGSFYAGTLLQLTRLLDL